MSLLFFFNVVNFRRRQKWRHLQDFSFPAKRRGLDIQTQGIKRPDIPILDIKTLDILCLHIRPLVALAIRIQGPLDIPLLGTLDIRPLQIMDLHPMGTLDIHPLRLPDIQQQRLLDIPQQLPLDILPLRALDIQRPGLLDIHMLLTLTHQLYRQPIKRPPLSGIQWVPLSLDILAARLLGMPPPLNILANLEKLAVALRMPASRPALAASQQRLALP